ncbi:DUF2852 domain-containing protein [Cognatiyoonia sp. IB215182]|uniref:DUF2852 domain-containing protein n=1 Tax=Cognatiyoonia sp. IB215182 TaxID=3097353 RepID=UPI002A144870|nr:DUF2852 domain-containing protein [Cognatiyoonia sp. IB215182]MDX8355201.1 DUF2852 domain-containing protein [Cognatiyoonia sp. IB215182]
MHDFTHMAASPGVLMFAFFAFAMFMPIMAFIAFAMFRWGWHADGAMPWPWMHSGGVFQSMGWTQQGENGSQESGNTAFDTYRAETLARLEEEAEAFAAFRDRFRAAKDREKFERFMDEMKSAPRQ